LNSRPIAIGEPLVPGPLRDFVQTSVRRACGGRAVAEIHRKPSDYHSSFPLDELSVRLVDGSQLTLIFKDVGPDVLSGSAKDAKPGFLFDSRREVEVYRKILPADQRFGPKLFGAVTDPSLGCYWLLLEKVRGIELYQVGELELWKSVVRRLAEMHRKLGPVSNDLAESAHLLRYDAAYFRRWPQRAQSFVGSSLSGAAADTFRRVVDRYDQVIDTLDALPTTFVHGEFYASNVLLERAGSATRVTAVDWEMAGMGSGLIDLAAIMSGAWTGDQRLEMALVYYDAIGSDLGTMSVAEFFHALDCCRLHIAMQWLGWSQNWRPPAGHAHDWLGDILEIAAQ